MYNHRIQRWKPGATVGITAAGGNGFGNGQSQLEEPGKIDIDSQGNLYIADTETTESKNGNTVDSLELL